jgi:hypothetical protein
MNKPVDQWAWWRNAVATKTVEEIHDGEPRSGFYRNRRKGEMAKAVAFWIDTKSGAQRCQVNGEDVDEQKAMEIWPYAAKEPITHEMFKVFADTGKWPDMDESAMATLPGQREVMGNNNPPTDPLTILTEQIESAKAGISQYANIDSDEKSAAAQSLRSRLLELGGDADKKRETEKKPHWDAGKAVDQKWKPLVDMAQNGANALRDALRGWEREKDRRLAAANLEVMRKAQEDAAKAAKEGKPLPPPPAPPPPPPVAAPIKGAYGRAASVRMVNVVTVTDYLAVFHAFKARAELQEFLHKMAKASIDAGHEVPGTTVTKEKDVR